MAKTRKLTPELLRRMIREEKAKMGLVEPDGFAGTLENHVDYESTYKASGKSRGKLPDGKLKTVEADGYADTLENHMDFYKALKIKEAKHREALRRILEQKRLVQRRILSK